MGHPMEPHLILFDIDGTLVDSAGAGRRATEQAFHEVFGLDSIGSRTAGVRFAGMTDPKIFGALADALGIPSGRLQARRRALAESYMRALDVQMRRPDPKRRALPGVAALLEALDACRHVYLGLVTGNLEHGARAKLEPFGLNRFFPGGGFGSDHDDRREIARLARTRLSSWAGLEFADSRVVVVGDTEHDIDCARANGFRSLAVESGWVSRECLRKAGPDALFSDLTDRPRVLEALGLAQLS